MPDFKQLGSAVKKWTAKDFQIKLVVILGLAGMALILLSQFVGDKKVGGDADAVASEQAVSEYALELENRLTGLLSGIEGVGETRVMITLEDTGEIVYAQEEKRNVDKQEEGSAEAVAKTYQKENVEQKYILVDGSNGRREALVRTQREPRIQGVVVVCEGAGNAFTEQNVIHVVTTALNIPTTRVCVVKISK